MADTGRGVSWALERACPLRSGEGWTRPDVTHRQLADVSMYSRGLLDRSVVDDICVTCYTDNSDRSDATVMLPYSGFRVSLALAPLGGEPAVRAACGACEANPSPDGRPVLANCHGFLDAWPDSEELENELRETIRLKGLEADVARLFPPTRPLWYGFWISSPLRRPHCELLLELLDEPAEPAGDWDGGLRHFLAALRSAVDWELPLHVETAPPGHTDLGMYTVFPHCPRCKAYAPVARWQKSYPDDPIDCEVCGHRYSPAATHKAEPMDDAEWDNSRLENLLGAGEVDAFRRRFLAQRGCGPDQIEDILDRARNGPLKRRINDLRRREEEGRRSRPAPAPSPGPLPPVLTLNPAGDVSLRLRLVPEGEFLMGSAGPPAEVGGEGPQHRVRIARPFYLGEFPVTQAQFEALLGRNPSRFRGDSDRPVERVSWFAAKEFCLGLSRAAGIRIRLPSEAEWEYACRAGTSSRYHWGEEVTDEQVNCKTGKPLARKRNTETNVQGRFPPNAWGLYDLHGNVQEWCEDEWHDNHDGAPADGSARVTPGDENVFRVLRGGSHWHLASACTSASRQLLRADADDEPRDLDDDGPLAALFRDRAAVGFRVACDADAARP